MRRLIALEALRDRLRDRDVQVLGITADDNPPALAEWGRSIGVSFGLVADADGRISRQYGMYSDTEQATARAFVAIADDRIVLRETVENTEVPRSLLDVLKL
jgi:alkyl hydroperoxide reductase subunit AhpC